MLSMVCTSASVAETAARVADCRITVKILITNKNSMTAKMAPNPQYNFLPMVMFKSLRFPVPMSPCAIARVALLGLSVEREFDDFHAFLRRRLEVPLFHSIERRVHQERAAAHHLRGYHVSVCCDRRLDFHLAGHVHLLCQWRIVRRHTDADFALARLGRRIVLSRGLMRHDRCAAENDCQTDRDQYELELHYLLPPTQLLRRYHLPVELEFDGFYRLFRSRFELKFLDRVHSGHYQQGAAANHARRCHAAVRSDRGFDL